MKLSKNDKKIWQEKFLTKIKKYHKRNLDKIVSKILSRAMTVKNSMYSRSKKHSVLCDITSDDLRNLLYESYGSPCKYCQRELVINNMVFDHIIPMSKLGDSTKKNLQIICKTCNNLKGSLIQEHFDILLNWFEKIPEELKKDIKIRLSKGIH